MASTNFVNYSPATPVMADWLNDANNAVYNLLGDGTHAPATKADALTNLGLALPGGAGLVGYLPAGTGASSSTVQSKLRESISVKDFGAVGDGVTDDRAAIAAAVVAARGKNLYFPYGQYLIDTDGGSITLEEVGLIGEFVLDGATTVLDMGAVFHVKGTTNSLFKIRRGTQIDSLGFYYPDQVDSATPIVYPPTLDFDYSNGSIQFVYIQNNVVYNAYRFISIGGASGNVGHVWIVNNTIYGIQTCIEIAYNAEVIKISENSFTFGHWLAATEAGCRGYTRANGVALLITRTDGYVFTDNMVYGYFKGMYFQTSETVCQLANISNNLFDNVRYCFYADGTGNLSGFQITGNSFLAFNGVVPTLSGNAIHIETTGLSVGELFTITGNSFSASSCDGIYTTGTALRTLVITGNIFSNWALGSVSIIYGAVNINGGATSYTLSGNILGSASLGYGAGVLGSCSASIITGNEFLNCAPPINASFVSTTITGNQSTDTYGTTSDVIAATNINQIGNLWDKPSGSTTSPSFKASKSSSESTSGTTPLVVTFGQELYDKGSNFGTQYFTVPRPGRYSFSYALMHNASGTAGDRFAIGIVNTSTGVSSLQSYKMIADYNSISGSCELQAAAGNLIAVTITRVGGSGVFTTQNDISYNWFCGSFIE